MILMVACLLILNLSNRKKTASAVPGLEGVEVQN
jgi:hypothetical protein